MAELWFDDLNALLGGSKIARNEKPPVTTKQTSSILK